MLHPFIKEQFQNVIKEFGKASVEYYGDGVISYDNSKRYSCNFGIVQLLDGDIYCGIDIAENGFTYDLNFLDREIDFQGITIEGFLLKFHTKKGSLFSFPFFVLIYQIPFFKIERGGEYPIKKINFGLANLLFTGNADDQKRLLLNLQNLGQISIQKLPNYDTVSRILKNHISIDVTSELIIPLRDDLNAEKAVEMSHVICSLLSICRGTKISWIYYTCYDDVERIIYEYHQNSITRPITNLPETIDSNPRMHESTKKFLEESYRVILENPILAKNLPSLSNVFTEARDGKGYIQGRGVKFVVLMEMLVKYVFEDPRFEIGEYILEYSTEKKTNKEIFKKCEEVIITQIKDSDNVSDINRWNLPTTEVIDEQSRIIVTRQELVNNLPSINRTSFKRFIVRLCEKINLTTTDTDIKMFVASRNKLIHTGNYYCDKASEDERRRLPPFATRFEEYAFLVNSIDKIFLKLCNYSGKYNNFRNWGSSLEDQI